MKKLIGAAAVFTAALCLFAACGREEKTGGREAYASPLYDWDTGGGRTLSVWGVYPELERSYIARAFARYQALTGNRLEIVQIPQEEFEERMLSAFQGGAGRPDVVLSYGGTNIEAYDPDNNFYDFTGEPWVDDLTDTAINQTVFNGRIIGLPHWEASVTGMLYNKKIFEKYGLEPPGTQEEFMETCAALLENGVTPVYLPGGETSMLLYQLPLDTLAENAAVLEGLNGGGLSYADIPEMERIVSWYRDMAQRGYFGGTYRTDGWEGMNEAMESGSYAMMLCWDTWLYTDYQGDPETFGLMPAFVGVPEEGTFEGPNLGLLIVNRESSNLDAALNFITFLADPYNYNAAFEGIYTAPVFKRQNASISTPQYLEAERLIEKHFRDSVSWLRIRGFSQMDASCILDYMDGTVKTARECLENMDRLREKRLGR